MGSSCEDDALIIFLLVGFAVNSFDRLPQLGAVGPVVYDLNEFSRLFSFVSRCTLEISSFIVDNRGEAGSCLRRSSRSSIMTKISAGTCCVYSFTSSSGDMMGSSLQ